MPRVKPPISVDYSFGKEDNSFWTQLYGVRRRYFLRGFLLGIALVVLVLGMYLSFK